MSPWTYILRSLGHHRRIHLAVALGVMAATAVLTGALLVGDSVRGSLRHLALDRLGRIDDVLVVDRFFRAALAEELAADASFQGAASERQFASATPAIVLPGGTLENDARGGPRRRAANVLIVGGDERFWQLGDPAARPKAPPGDGQIVLNAPLAAELGVQVGDDVVLRLPRNNQVPADSPLGKKEDRIQTLAGLRVVDVLPAESLGRFSLRSSQQQPRNAYVSLGVLQSALEQPDKVNAILVAETSPSRPAVDAAKKLDAALRPEFGDYGFSVHAIRSTYRPKDAEQEQVAFEYLSFTSDRMMIEPAAQRIAEKAFADWHPQPVLTYLAIGIEKVVAGADAANPSIPYSTITAVDSTPELGPLLVDAEGRLLEGEGRGKPLVLADDEIVLNRWAADDLKARPGDTIRVTFFEPETTHGEALERSAEFRLKAIAPLTEPNVGFRKRRPPQYVERPTLANDSDLTPTVEGVTDQDSIDDWDPPFPFEQKRVRDQDDTYWQNHRTTPKAFVSLAAGRRLWGSRFGETTSYRLPLRSAAMSDAAATSTAGPLTVATVEKQFVEQLRRDGATLGMAFLPVKLHALYASSGTTPFDGLFLGLSLFIITAALLLVALLFRLGVEQRASELGVLSAVGVPQRLAASMAMREGAIVAAIGGAVGTVAGVGYAWLMLAGLRTWWLGAITTPFLNLYVTPLSLAIGYVAGLLASVAMIYGTIRRARRVPVRRLLSGEMNEPLPGVGGRSRFARPVAAGLFALAVVLAIAATQLAGEAQAGSFVGAGMLLLMAMLLEIWLRFAQGPSGGGTLALQLGRLAARNAGRNPSRSTLTIGLMAIASFLLIALSAFRLDPSLAGAGGFATVAESSQPIFVDLNRPEVRGDLLGDKAKLLESSRVFGLRLKPGDDASCNNLYQATQPRVLGVTDEFVRHFDGAPDAAARQGAAGLVRFDWAASVAVQPADRANPWRLLQTSADDRQSANDLTNQAAPIPVVLDKNTAMYALHLYGGVGQEFSIEYEDGVTARFRVAGLLSNSILQGALVIDERQFVKLFPRSSGYRYFLIQTPDERRAEVASLLEDTFSDQGFDSSSTRTLLESLLAVQNTYLSTFQSLGALGLLLGTFGLATVQLRNVFERRKELALMRAAGFSRGRLARMVLYEHLVLLLGGLGVGVFAALVAVAPHMLSGGAAAPWRDLAWMLAAVLATGLLSGFAAVRATLRAPLIASLRGD